MRVNVVDYGAVGDGVTLNTAAFASAVEACSQAGGGYVSVPAGQFVTGTVELKSHVYLELLPGAELLGSMRIADYRGTRRGSAWDPRISAHINQKLVADADDPAPINPCKALVLAEDQHHVGIIGHGTLNGRRGYAFPSGEEIGNPFLVVFSHCADVTLENVSMTNPGPRMSPASALPLPIVSFAPTIGAAFASGRKRRRIFARLLFPTACSGTATTG